MDNELKFAILIDSDNISEKYVDIIMEETANEGVATYKRIYGDWTSPTHASWKSVLLAHSIIPIQQYSYTTGKSATDSAMIIDAMDILYSGNVTGFCLVSSDSDFTRLAARLREAGMHVIGMGEEKTPKAFISACNQFKYLDRLYKNKKEKEKKEARKLRAQRHNEKHTEKEKRIRSELDIVRETITAIMEKSSDEDGWIFSGKLGDQLSKRLPDFDVRNFGFNKLTPFIKSLGEYEINKISAGNGQQQIYFRTKEKS